MLAENREICVCQCVCVSRLCLFGPSERGYHREEITLVSIVYLSQNAGHSDTKCLDS